MISNELKALEVKRSAIERELETLKAEASQARSAYDTKVAELRETKKEIEGLKRSNDPIVSEHAMLRYVEREMGIDLEDIRRRILTPKNVKAIRFAGSCKIKSGRLEFIVRDNVVVSTVER